MANQRVFSATVRRCSLFYADHIIERAVPSIDVAAMAMADGKNVGGPGPAEHHGGGQNSESDDAALRARLSNLTSALDRLQQTSSETKDGDDADQSFGAATNLGLRVLVEFVTAVVVGPLIGWQIDAWFHTAPIFLIIFLILGMVAGFLNVYRIGTGKTGPGTGAR